MGEEVGEGEIEGGQAAGGVEVETERQRVRRKRGNYLLLDFQELWVVRCVIEATPESRVYFGSSG